MNRPTFFQNLSFALLMVLLVFVASLFDGCDRASDRCLNQPIPSYIHQPTSN